MLIGANSLHAEKSQNMTVFKGLLSPEILRGVRIYHLYFVFKL